MSGTFAAARRLIGRLLLIAFSLVLLVAVIGWMSGWYHPKIQPGELEEARRELAPGQTTVPARLLTTPQTVDVVGSIEPFHKALVASQVMAVIHRVFVRAGQSVDEGQLLVELDDRELQAQSREAEAAIAASDADLNLRKREVDRYKMMLAGNAVTKEQFDTVQGAYEVAVAQQRRAKEQFQRVKTMLSYTRIHAQAPALVTDRFVDPGDLAAPGKPLLALHDPKQLEMHASVPEKLARGMRPGMALNLRVESASLDLQGTLREIVPQVQAGSRSMLMKIQLPPDKSGDLYVGMFGRVYLPVGESQRLVVPATAVREVGQLQLVDIVRADRSLERRFVQTGGRFGDDVEILSGIAAGETVALPESAKSARQPSQGK
jgi:RND family efflux transporter MFP subunit